MLHARPTGINAVIAARVAAVDGPLVVAAQEAAPPPGVRLRPDAGDVVIIRAPRPSRRVRLARAVRRALRAAFTP